MTEVSTMGTASAPAAPAAVEDRGYSKDYWDIVFEQLFKRTLFKVGLGVLAVLYAVALYAPLLANDKPYVVEAIDYGEYDSAVRSISAVASSLSRKLEKTEAEYAAQITEYGDERRAQAPPTLAADLAGEHSAAEQRLDIIRLYLPESALAPLDAWESDLDAAIASHASGDLEAAAAAGEDLKTRAREFRRELQAARPGDEPGEGVQLLPNRSYPLFESISKWEVFFMALWAFVLTWPLWNRAINAALLGGDRERIRRWRRLKLVGVLGLSLLAAGSWWATIDGGGTPFSVSPWKAAITSGKIVTVGEPVWPPLRYGYAEGHPNERFRPPTWTENAEIDWAGYYVHGGRVARPADFSADTPIAVRERVRAATDVLQDPDAGEPAWESAREELEGLARDPARPDSLSDVRPHLIAEVWRMRNDEGEAAGAALRRLSDTLAAIALAFPQPDPEDVEARSDFALAKWWPSWAYENDALPEGLRPGGPVILRAGEPPVNAATRHLAGTDEQGRDFLVRMIWGSRVSLSVGIISAALLTVIGVVIGSLAGFFGGWVDVAIMRLIEILQAIPAFFLMLIVLAFTDPNVVPPIIAIVVVIAMIRWTGAARLVRGEFLRLREQEFVVAARALGFSSRRTIFKHVLPNAMSPVLVNAAFAVAAGILTESAISFLGFGVQHPEASWGSLVNDSRSPEHWWIQVFPGLLIFLTVTCYNLVGDAIRDALDPKLKAA